MPGVLHEKEEGADLPHAESWTALAPILLSTAIAYWSAPSAGRAKTAEDFGLKFEPVDMSIEPSRKPGEWLEYSPLLTVLIAGLLAWYLIDVFRTSPTGTLAALDLNPYNLLFITLGMLLHWRPKRFLRAVSQSVPAPGGVLIQLSPFRMPPRLGILHVKARDLVGYATLQMLLHIPLVFLCWAFAQYIPFVPPMK